MSKQTKVYIQYGEEFDMKEKVEWLHPVSLPVMHSVGVTQKFERIDGEVVTASKLVGQGRWVVDKVVR